MPIATINYPSIPSNQPKISQRYLNLFVKNGRKGKTRRSFLSDVSTQSSVSLPPIKLKEKRSSSIRINGKSFLGSQSTHSFRLHSPEPPLTSERRTRSNSRDSTSRLIRLKFGHPFKQRSADFYRPNLSQSELILREQSFVNDSIRSAHQSRRSSIIPPYDPFNDPYLNEYFQSSFVVDMVQKNLQIDLRKQNKRSKTIPRENEDYRRIVAKKSSGYGRLNGYDCIPPYARHSRLNSINSSFRSFSTATDHNNSSLTEKMKHRQQRQPLPPLAHSSPIGQIPSDE